MCRCLRMSENVWDNMLTIARLGNSDRTAWLFDRRRQELAASFGLRFVSAEKPHDLRYVWIKDLDKLPSGFPCVIEDCRDVTSVAEPTRSSLLDLPHVKAYLRQIVYRRPEAYDDPVAVYREQCGFGERTYARHSPVEVLNRTGVHFPKPELSLTSRAKIRLAFPISPVQPGKDGCLSVRAIKPLASRPVDVTFIGQTSFSNDAVEHHRRCCWNAIARLNCVTRLLATNRPRGYHRQRALPGRRLSHAEFMKQTRQSRIVVSPWGWGVWCWRDLEALLSGCVVIKPRCDEHAVLGDLYSDRYMVWCRPDFSDLSEKVSQVLDSLPSLEERYTQQIPHELQTSLSPKACLRRFSHCVQSIVQSW